MQSTIDSIRTMLKTLNLHNAAQQIEDILSVPLNKTISYEKFLMELLQREIKGRRKTFERNLKQASFPEYKTLDEFDLSEQPSLSKRQFNQLRELSWIEQGLQPNPARPDRLGKPCFQLDLVFMQLTTATRFILQQ